MKSVQITRHWVDFIVSEQSQETQCSYSEELDEELQATPPALLYCVLLLLLTNTRSSDEIRSRFQLF